MKQTVTELIQLLPLFKNHFDQLQYLFISFCNHGIQTEAWFKRELLTHLNHLKKKGQILRFDREVKTEHGRIDLAIDIGDVRHWIELKHWLIGKQKRIKIYVLLWWSLISGHLWRCEEAWHSGEQKFNEKFAPEKIVPETSPDDYPGSYFLGLLKVR